MYFIIMNKNLINLLEWLYGLVCEILFWRLLVVLYEIFVYYSLIIVVY